MSPPEIVKNGSFFHQAMDVILLAIVGALILLLARWGALQGDPLNAMVCTYVGGVIGYAKGSAS